MPGAGMTVIASWCNSALTQYGMFHTRLLPQSENKFTYTSVYTDEWFKSWIFRFNTRWHILKACSLLLIINSLNAELLLSIHH